MAEHAVTFKFKDGDKEKAEYYASEADRDLIVQFLEYFKEKEMVYMDGTDHVDLDDAIKDIKGASIVDGVLTLTPAEFWGVHRFFRKHQNVTEEFKQVSVENFSIILEELRKAFYIVLTPQVPVGD